MRQGFYAFYIYISYEKHFNIYNYFESSWYDLLVRHIFEKLYSLSDNEIVEQDDL